MEARMRWDDTHHGDNKCWRWYDLLDGDGTETDGLLGYVGENLVDKAFVACINTATSPVKEFDNLEDAKNHILTYYVVEKLEGA
jgi:hypothetical protein